MGINPEEIRQQAALAPDELVLSVEHKAALERNDRYLGLMDSPSHYLGRVLGSNTFQYFEAGSNEIGQGPFTRAIIGPHNILKSNRTRHDTFSTQARAIVSVDNLEADNRLLTCYDFVIDLLRNSTALHVSSFKLTPDKSGRVLWPRDRSHPPKVILSKDTPGDTGKKRILVHTGRDYERVQPVFDDRVKLEAAEKYRKFAELLTPETEVKGLTFDMPSHRYRIRKRGR